MIFCLFVDVFNFESSGLLCDLTSLMDVKEADDFLFCLRVLTLIHLYRFDRFH